MEGLVVAGVVVVVLEGFDEVLDCFEIFCGEIVVEIVQSVFEGFEPYLHIVPIEKFF